MESERRLRNDYLLIPDIRRLFGIQGPGPARVGMSLHVINFGLARKRR